MDRFFRRIVPRALRQQAVRRDSGQQQRQRFLSRARWPSLAIAAGRVSGWPRKRWMSAGGALALVLVAALGIPAWVSMLGSPATTPVPHKTVALALPDAPIDNPPVEAAPADTTPVKVVPTWQTVAVLPGQTLSGIFHSEGLSATDLANVLATGKHTDALKALHPGDQLGFLIDAAGHLKGFRYHPDAGTVVTLTAADGGLHAEVTTLSVHRHMRFAHGVVHHSLSAAGEKAGLPGALVLKLAHVFKYAINFAHDVRAGDHFTVIYNDIFRNGKLEHPGSILAAEYVNDGHRYAAYRFTKPDGSVGYYSPGGRPLRRTLLRMPLTHARISSRFGMRMDPILHKVRLHAGVDYAAPIGTPVHAAGNGVITFRGKQRGYGNFIEIRDSSQYSTCYGHMSRFASGLHVGSHVHQGQVIGYVGDTGWSTGPHLHFEVRVDGKPVNPLTVVLPPPKPLSGKLLAEFRAQTAPLAAHIRMIDHASQRVASVASDDGDTANTN